jgi:hypothetical protein
MQEANDIGNIVFFPGLVARLPAFLEECPHLVATTGIIVALDLLGIAPNPSSAIAV